MQYRRLGKSGLKVSTLSFGSWVTFGTQLDQSNAAQCMKIAYDSGVNFFDNAEVYADGASEKIMGDILQKFEWSRDSYCVSSKVFWGGDLPTQRGLSRKHIVDACHAALRRLQVEYLDMYFCHRPDAHTPIEETVRAMSDLITQGKVLYWGTSEWSADQIMQAYGAARQYGLVPPTMEQPQYNMFFRQRVEAEYARLYSEIGLGTTIWSPLASGLLTGKYNKGIPAGSRLTLKDYEWLKERIFDSKDGQVRIEKTIQLQSLALDLGTSLAKLAIAWCAANPNVSTVILGASRPEQLKETLDSLSVIPKLTTSVLDKIDKILQNKPEPAPEF